MTPQSNSLTAVSRIKVRSQRTNPQSNVISTADTVSKMIGNAVRYSLCPTVISATQSCLAPLQQPSQTSQTDKGYSSQIVRAVFWWVKNHVQFQEDDSIMSNWGIDPNANGGRDFLITPDLLLSMNPPMGDCDDFSTLVASMLICAGFIRSFGRGWFVTIAADPRDTTAFTHVYTKWFCPDAVNNPYIYIDASHGLYPGWESPVIYRKKEWEIR